MTITALPSQQSRQHIVLHDVSWESYQRLSRDLENGATRLTYDKGVLELVAPLALHERCLSVFKLRRGKYVAAKKSETFPFLQMEEFEQFLLRMFSGEAQLPVLKEFRKWLRTL